MRWRPWELAALAALVAVLMLGVYLGGALHHNPRRHRNSTGLHQNPYGVVSGRE